MNNVVREVGGTLGIAALGSLLAGAYASSMDGAVTGLPGDAAIFLPARARAESVAGGELPEGAVA